MAKLIVAILLVLLVIYVVPLVVYGAASLVGAVQPPATTSAGRFLAGVLITKLGTAIAFVALFVAAASIWGPRWPLYALVWFVAFAFSEVGETVSGRTHATEAMLGVVSEAIYAPLAAFLLRWLLWRGPA